jgi:hypothetical protein
MEGQMAKTSRKTQNTQPARRTPQPDSARVAAQQGRAAPTPVPGDKVEEAKPTEPMQEDTALAEAHRRVAGQIDAPTPADRANAKTPAEAQTISDVATLMGANSDSPAQQEDEAPTTEEFDELHGNVIPAGATPQDMQNRQNAEVARLTSEHPPKEIIQQRKEARSLLPGPVVPETMRSLSLEEMGQQKLELGAASG